MAELRLAPRSPDSQARALSTTLHRLLKPLTGEKTEAQRGLFFWDSLGQAEREGGRERSRKEEKLGPAPTMISTRMWLVPWTLGSG